MAEKLSSACLRWLGAALGVTGLALLAGCGGGNGAPNNPYEPPPPTVPALTVLPASITVYPGTPATLTINGGVAPYRAFSTDATALPVGTSVSGNTIVLAANQVAAATNVTVTVQDAAGTTSAPVSVTIQPAPLLSSLITITGNPNPACTSTDNSICSGGTGTATVKVTGNGGLGISGRSVRFDVVQGAFSMVSTNPATPLVSTLTTTTDGNGNAVVVLSVSPDTPTQTGILRATDLTTGQQITGTFQILQMTVGGEVLSVLPLGLTTITGPDNTKCSSGVSVAYYIFGGTPPYKVETNFPQAVTITGTPVTRSGGSFVVTTNGSCFIGLTFVITDATGRTIPGGSYPTITNQLGTTAPIPPTTPLVVTPGAIAKANCAPSNTFQFIGTGGVPPYSAVITSTSSPTSPVLSPQTGIAAGTAVTVSGISSPSTTTITVLDNATPRQTGTVTIDCSGSAPPPTPSALVVTPSSTGNAAVTCAGAQFNFSITGGTAPYNVFFQSPSSAPGATISPNPVTAPGTPVAVTFGASGATTTAVSITVTDSSNPPSTPQVATINCKVGP